MIIRWFKEIAAKRRARIQAAEEARFWEEDRRLMAQLKRAELTHKMNRGLEIVFGIMERQVQAQIDAIEKANSESKP